MSEVVVTIKAGSRGANGWTTVARKGDAPISGYLQRDSVSCFAGISCPWCACGVVRNLVTEIHTRPTLAGVVGDPAGHAGGSFSYAQHNDERK